MANANIEAIFPLNSVQDGILYHTLYAPGSSLYVQQYVATVDGPLDVERFRTAWDRVIGRHQALRSFVTWDEREQPLQIIRGSVLPEWADEDWSGSAVEHQSELLSRFLEDDRRRGFVLDEAPLMRFAVFRLGPESHRFVWTHHHIVLDGWSLGIVLEEVFSVYGGGGEALPEPVSLRSHVAWYRQQDWNSSESHWRPIVGDIEAGTYLGIEADRSQPWADRQVEATHVVDRQVSERVRALARDSAVSLSTVFRAAWGLLLARYADQETVVFGAAVAGRPAQLSGSLDVVGMFINSLPVRVDVDPDETVGVLLQRLQADQVASHVHESTPLARIQAWSAVHADDALFHSLLVFENVPQALPAGGGIAVTSAEYLQESNYPVSILVMPGEEIGVHLLYDPDRYREDAIQRLLVQLETTLASLSENPELPLRDVESLTDDEIATLLDPPPVPEAGILPETTIHRLIVDRAKSQPTRLAVTNGTRSLTYGQLEQRSGEIAACLAAQGVGPGDLVVMSAARTLATIVAMAGVLRSGAGYVPIDPDAPAKRLALVIEDTGASVVVGEPGTEVPEGVALLAVGSDGSPSQRISDPVPEVVVEDDDLAYVMYTSGSTGHPKGVMVTHRNLISSTLARRPVYGREPGTFLVVSPLFFDSSVAGVYSTLVEGGVLVLPEPDMEQDVNHLAALIERHSVTHTLMVPALYGLLLEHTAADRLRSLTTVIVAGEPCPAALVAAHHEHLPGVRLFNEYGPTEATVWSAVAELSPADAVEPVTIGGPIPGTAIFVLDRMLRPSPIGALGELCVAGPGVAQGYLGRPDLTTEAFVSVRAATGESVRTYRTGDVARWRTDGRLELSGRRDHQVKIRGQRIELGEIEAVLKSHPDVREAVVVLSGEAAREPSRIVAWVEPASADSEELRRHTAERLPQVMVPTVVVPVEALPRSATGKVDRRTLESRELEQPATEAGKAAPSSETEQVLAEIWAAVLGVEAVGVHDNFFDLGGDSILTIRIIARAHEAGLSITPRQFFDHPTVGELARVVGMGSHE